MRYSQTFSLSLVANVAKDNFAKNATLTSAYVKPIKNDYFYGEYRNKSEYR
jgi:hypothetical protein